MKSSEVVRLALEESAQTKRDMIDSCGEDISRAAEWIAQAMTTGHKLLICGNGGSAADAQHIATEFVVRLTSHNDRAALPALALTTDTSTLTAAANDYGFDKIFARQVEAHGGAGDVLIAISTSGKSPNVIQAAEAAHDRGMKVIAFLGAEKNALGNLADLCICIPTMSGQRVQEGHITAGHIIVALTEQKLLELNS
ncbi:MAG: SIS domain-containing protein [bacterium]